MDFIRAQTDITIIFSFEVCLLIFCSTYRQNIRLYIINCYPRGGFSVGYYSIDYIPTDYGSTNVLARGCVLRLNENRIVLKKESMVCLFTVQNIYRANKESWSILSIPLCVQSFIALMWVSRRVGWVRTTSLPLLEKIHIEKLQWIRIRTLPLRPDPAEYISG